VRLDFSIHRYFAILNKATITLLPSSGGTVANADLSPLTSFTVGFAARATATMLLLPLTVLKTRLEAGDDSGGGMVGSLRRILAQEGPRALFRGMIPSVPDHPPFASPSSTPEMT
jgi:hypothetical protein